MMEVLVVILNLVWNSFFLLDLVNKVAFFKMQPHYRKFNVTSVCEIRYLIIIDRFCHSSLLIIVEVFVSRL